MALDLTPMRRDWPAITVGDTYPAQNYAETLADSNLVRVRVKVRDADGVLKLTLDSDDTGITINTATAGAWDFNIDEISNTLTGTLTEGLHKYDLETTDAAGRVRTEFKGNWELLPQTTD